MSFHRVKSNIVEAIDSPALLIYPDIVKENISTAQSILDVSKNNSLRPHIKSVKCLEVIQMTMGHGIEKFKCSTIAEAELLGMAGAKDVLLNYQLSTVKAQRFRELIESYPDVTFSCLVDNIESAQIMSALTTHTDVNVYIDINLGMDRTGIKADNALSLLKELRQLNGIKVQGFHCYEGHIDSSNRGSRLEQAFEAYLTMMDLKRGGSQIMERDLAVVLGGSPNFEYYGKQCGLECSPGTFFLWDYGYGKNYPEIPFKIAAFVLTRIISIIDEKKMCLDLGYKAVASDSPLPRVKFPELPEYTVLGQYEEHLVIEVPDTSVFNVGSPLYAVPYHICPTVNLYEKVFAIENGQVTDTWDIVARDRQINI
ncbi:MAG: D-TA family PLP-dependent enzyme [Cyclobacteriaceae bacterium]|nr:D-TA family PLP-dependent enzyme [Cyclobacteriaceae bacterium SS2]